MNNKTTSPHISYSEIENNDLLKDQISQADISDIQSMIKDSVSGKDTGLTADSVEYSLKLILMGSLHYGINTAKIIELFTGHYLLVPTLLQMIRERPWYPEQMARVLLSFEYLEYISIGFTVLSDQLTENEIDCYKRLRNINDNNDYQLLLLDILIAHAGHKVDARSIYFMYYSYFLNLKYKTEAQTVLNIRKEFSDILL